VLVTDGPFGESAELVVGLNVLTCLSLAQAVQIASQHPAARVEVFQVRPFA
jgi:hypothetical protein